MPERSPPPPKSYSSAAAPTTKACAENSPGDGTGRAWGPYYLGTYDLKDIKDSGALFIRKVSPLVDANILHILPVDDHSLIPDISWPGTSEC